MKRFIALVLSLVMALSLCAPAWGAEGETATKLPDAVKGVITLTENVTLSEPVSITEDTVIEGCGYTLTYTGSNRAIEVAKETDGADLTINNLTIAFSGGYRERGINYNTTGTLTLNNVTVGSKTAFPTYAVNFPGSANGATVVIDECNLYGCIALNVWGKDMTVTVTDSNLTTVDNADTEGYAVVKLNNDGTTAAEGSVINISGGSVNIIGSNTNKSQEFSNATSTGTINIDNPPGGSVGTIVAAIRYAGNTSYGFSSVQGAIDHAVKTDKATTENLVTIYILETAYASGGSFNPAEGVVFVLPEGYICAESSATGEYVVQKKVTAENVDATSVNTAAKNKDLQDAISSSAAEETKVTVVEGTGSSAKTTTVEFNDAATKTEFANAATSDITTEVAIADVTEVVKESVASPIKSKVDSAIGTTAKVATYLDIDIHVFVGGSHVGQITELPETIKIAIDVADLDLDPVDSGYTRTFYVVRDHDGVIELIPAEVSGGKLVFSSNKFSTYAVVYKDTAVSYGSYNPSTSTKPVQSAQTFDAGIAMYVGMSVMAAAGSAVVLKKKD